MKRFMYVLLAVMLLTSCSQAERFGNVSFTRGTSRDLFASIEYPDENSLLWDITATKLSSGSKVGEGFVEDALLTDTFGPFSVGRWSFELNGKKEGDGCLPWFDYGTDNRRPEPDRDRPVFCRRGRNPYFHGLQLPVRQWIRRRILGSSDIH